MLDVLLIDDCELELLDVLLDDELLVDELLVDDVDELVELLEK